MGKHRKTGTLAGNLRELPGRAPDHQPAIGDADCGPGAWAEPKNGRNGLGVPDQRFATGVTATGPKGKLLEYMVNYPDSSGVAKDIDFDGHLWRGHPPTEDKAVTKYLEKNPHSVVVDVKFIPTKG